jgi:hypothetical protein
MDSNHDEAIHCFLALKDSLEVTDAELHIEPIRFWLVTFKRAGTDEEFIPYCYRMGQTLRLKTEE